MEAKSLIACIAFVSAFFTAAMLVPYMLRAMTKRLHSSRTQYQVIDRTSYFDFLLRNGITWFKPLATRLLANKLVRRYAQDAHLIVEEKGLHAPVESLCSLFIFILLVGFGFGSLIGSSWVFGLVCDVGCIIAAVTFIAHCKDARTEAIREAVPDALRSMSACSHVGLSLQQSFDYVANEIKGPLKPFFVRASNDLAAGVTIAEALARFKRDAQVSELGFVALAFDVQHRTGGSLKQVLDSARDSVESELSLRRNLRVQTAQAKLSARIVSLMPFVLLALFSFLSPGFLSPFFTSIAGFVLLGIAILMQLSGIMLVRRLLDVARD